ncbi:MAG: hypothetical protein JOY91_11570 [Sinobacteraceae bacterium]|nr:hypothetical protein [Nevskiaceae bacterium]
MTQDIAFSHSGQYSFIGLMSGPILGAFSRPTAKEFDFATGYGGALPRLFR